MKEILKKYRNLIRCHYNYAFNKTVLLVILIVIILSIAYNFSILSSLKLEGNDYVLYKYYFDAFFSLVLFFANILIMTIISFSFLKKQDQYCVLLLTSDIAKGQIFLSKYFTIILFLLLFLVTEIIAFYVPAVFTDKLKYINVEVLISFFDLFLVMIFYGNVSLLIILIFDNFYSVIVPLSLFLFSYNSSNSQSDIFIKYIISFNSKNWRLNQKYGFVIMINMLLIFLSFKIYLKNEC